MSTWVLVAVVAIVLGGCVTDDKKSVAGNGETGRAVPTPTTAPAPTAELTHYEHLEFSVSDLIEAAELADYFRIPEAATGRKINPESLEFFRNAENARRWLGEGYHRAITAGHPAKSCPFYYASWQAKSVQDALYRALYRCLSYVKDVDNLTGGSCGCRVIALDDTLFGPADGFQYRSLLPTMVMRAPARTKDFALKMAGFLELDGHLGKDQPVQLLDGKGDALCSGTYSSGKPGQGKLRFSCHDEPGVFIGAYQVLGFYAGREYGLAFARSDQADLVAMFGLTEKNFADRWREVAEKLKH